MVILFLVTAVAGLIGVGYARGKTRTSNLCYEEVQELIAEKNWWVDKFNDSQDDLKGVKKELKDAICRNDDLWNQNEVLIKENDALTNKLTQYMLRYGELKMTIEMGHQEEIIQYYNEGLSYKEIAKKIGCGASTIQRAVKKRGLVR